jgi:hypothetical protein
MKLGMTRPPIYMRNPVTQTNKVLAHLGKHRSPHWPAVRRKWLLENPKCAACGSTNDLEVHHILSYHLHPDLELEPSNFITLCEVLGSEHHLHIGHCVNGQSSWKINNPNVREDAAAMLKSLA